MQEFIAIHGNCFWECVIIDRSSINRGLAKRERKQKEKNDEDEEIRNDENENTEKGDIKDEEWGCNNKVE